ncbi:MAG: tetratricopeptide repeat protein [Pyrinomonadaceae bacterium MAG19_C2-C3]|nr:tetratricopeptide repeat protein [Pyrinomonadaceae bacterium MAG19_C2-C3]
MNIKKGFIPALLMLALCCLASFNTTSANAAKPAATTNTAVAPAKDTWTRIRTKNFVLVGNANEKDIRKVGAQLEQFQDALSRLLSNAKFTSSKPTTVVVFKNDGAYKPYKPLYNGKPASVAGYFQPGEDVNYITLTPERAGENPYATIYHELVHLMVENTLRTVPAWLNEGIAELYSTFEIADGDKKVTLGRPLTHHILTLREKFIPLDVLFQVDGRSPLYNEKDKQGIFYAESWALMHYLMFDDNAARRPQLGKFIGGLTAGRPVADSFRDAFQTDYKTMEKQLQKYVRGSSYVMQQFKFEESLKRDEEMQSSVLSEAEALAYLGDLLLHINRTDVAEKHLKDALALDGKLASAHASLGMVYVRARDFDRARASLEQAVAANSGNYLAHYYYALALSRAGMDANNLVSGYSPDTIAKMKAELKRAIELAPDYAESHSLLAFVHLIAGDDLDEGVRAVTRARRLAPGRADYAFTLAQLQMRQRKFAEARNTISAAMRAAGEPQLLAQMQAFNRQLETTEASFKQYEEQRRQYEAERGAYEKNSTTMNGETADDARPALNEDAAPSTRPMIKRRTEGEQVRGQLTRIECLPKGIVLHIEVGTETLKFFKAALEDVQFISYIANMSAEIGCNTSKLSHHVLVTFKKFDAPGREKYKGEVVIVEFIPEDTEVAP